VSGGLGHQGQDIPPAFCKQRIEGANRCEPYLHDVVAVRDGAVLRAPTQERFNVVVNPPNERIRSPHCTCCPSSSTADGMGERSPRARGEVIARIGNFFRRERATTYHLPLRYAGADEIRLVFVNPT